MKILLLLLLLVSCSTKYPNRNPVGEIFPSVKGQALSGEEWTIPNGMQGKQAILLVGYKQDTQFDIDRWLIGLDMKSVETPTYEIPTIAGLFPRMFATKIDAGMRRGIPKELWKGVITIYKDGETVQKFTGNERPNNARVILLDTDGKILYFQDNGFSVGNLNALIDKLQ
jgi:hypothetical protein